MAVSIQIIFQMGGTRCSSHSWSICLLYFCIAYSIIGLFLMIHFNYNKGFAIALMIVPPIPLILLLIASHQPKIEPQEQECNIFVIPVKPYLYCSKNSIIMTDSLC